jgi:HEAT repeat protein
MNPEHFDHQHDTKTENWNVWKTAIMSSPRTRMPPPELLRACRLRDKTVIPCLKSNLTPVRKNAALALGRADDKKAIEPLIAALLDPDDEVRKAAARSLQGLTGQRDLYDAQNASKDEAHRAWQKWWTKNKDTFTVTKRGRGMALNLHFLIVSLVAFLLILRSLLLVC